jgi:acyl-CoA reductase-like NAD-dependent aldehyde dehydrogenase
VLTEIPPECSILREESFGPVLPIVRVRDAEEAVEKANALPYGLSASVWTKNQTRGVSIAQRLRAGAVCVNDTIVHFGVPALPFGGVGESGFGRSHGLDGLREMTRTRSVLVDRLNLEREPWWFPYSRRTERLLRATVLFRLRGGVRGLAAAAMHMLTGKRRR